MIPQSKDELDRVFSAFATLYELMPSGEPWRLRREAWDAIVRCSPGGPTIPVKGDPWPDGVVGQILGRDVVICS